MELIVNRATAAGVCAAVAAARHGVDVRLLESGRHVGGMVSGGLGYTDAGDRRVLGGYAGRFRAEVAAWYDVAPDRFAGPEPHVAEAIFLRWLDEAGVDLRLGCSVDSVEMRDQTITALVDDTGTRHPAGVVVDASYEGDLLALAGVPYRVGREGRQLYDEPLAGRREITPGKHQFPPWISPFDEDALLPFVHSRPLAEPGTGDGGVMAYGYRVCLTRSSDRIPFPRRDGYDPAEWELARRYLRSPDTKELRASSLLGLVQNLPNDKCDGNSIGPFSLNLLDGTQWAYPDGDERQKDRIAQRHLAYTQDFLYFLSNDPEVSAAVREDLAGWGLPRDEFTDSGGWPHQLYVREARRMLGEFVLTEHDLRPGPRRHYDAIAMGSYHIDIREVQRSWQWSYEHPDSYASVVNEGYLSVGVEPYQIPYRCLVPRYDDCTNLLVPVCLSASHVAFSSVRMEPQYEMLGHAAGLAAAQALRRDRPVQRVDPGGLQDQLAAEGQVLAL